jgi:hypothetical protein
MLPGDAVANVRPIRCESFCSGSQSAACKERSIRCAALRDEHAASGSQAASDKHVTGCVLPRSDESCSDCCVLVKMSSSRSRGACVHRSALTSASSRLQIILCARKGDVNHMPAVIVSTELRKDVICVCAVGFVRRIAWSCSLPKRQLQLNDLQQHRTALCFTTGPDVYSYGAAAGTAQQRARRAMSCQPRARGQRIAPTRIADGAALPRCCTSISGSRDGSRAVLKELGRSGAARGRGRGHLPFAGGS